MGKPRATDEPLIDVENYLDASVVKCSSCRKEWEFMHDAYGVTDTFDSMEGFASRIVAFSMGHLLNTHGDMLTPDAQQTIRKNWGYS